MSSKIEKVFALCIEIADSTWRYKVEITLLDPKTGQTWEKEMRWPNFYSNYVRLAEADPESNKYLPATTTFFHAKYVCEPDRNGMEIWPVGSDKSKATFISRKQFVRFFHLLAFVSMKA